MEENEKELKSLLMKVKEESANAGLKFSIQKTKTMASGPISSVLLLSCSTLCNPMDWTCQTSLSITNSWGLLKLMSIELVMPSNHLVFYCPLLLLPLMFSSIRVFSNETVLLWFHQFMANRWGNSGNSDSLYFLGLLNLCRWWLQPWN